MTKVGIFLLFAYISFIGMFLWIVLPCWHFWLSDAEADIKMKSGNRSVARTRGNFAWCQMRMIFIGLLWIAFAFFVLFLGIFPNNGISLKNANLSFLRVNLFSIGLVCPSLVALIVLLRKYGFYDLVEKRWEITDFIILFGPLQLSLTNGLILKYLGV